jgi:hypothetical protein
MTQVLFTRSSKTDTGITVTLKRLVDSKLVSENSYDTFTYGSTVYLRLTDKYGNSTRVTFMVNRISHTGAATLRSITSIALLKNQPKVGSPTTYEVSKR